MPDSKDKDAGTDVQTVTAPAPIDRLNPDDGRVELVVDNAPRLYDDDALAGITTFTDAFAAAEAEGGVEDWADYGTGYDLAEKGTLVGVPILLQEWKFNPGDFGLFVSVVGMTEDDRKFIINDGSTGLAEQLWRVTEQRKRKGHPRPQTHLIVKSGLRESSYYRHPDGTISKQPQPLPYVKATTYYLG